MSLLIFPNSESRAMIIRILLINILVILAACAQQKDENSENVTVNLKNKSFNQFFYSKSFADRFNIKKGKLIENWQGMIGIAIQGQTINNDFLCNAKLYLGNDVNFDYPPRDNFINIMGDRYDEIFSFTSDVSDDDARHHAQLIFQSGNKIAIHGYKDNKESSSTGFNIDYVIKNAAKDITYVKTINTLCENMHNKNHKYYLRLKPKGVTQRENFLKYYIPINQ